MMGENKSDIFKDLSFYIYPCAVRASIRELVNENGGTFCRARGHGVISLTENKNFKQGTHIDFIYDSIKNKKLLDRTNYELPKYALKDATNIISISSTKLHSARSRYEPEEDEAILQYVAKHGQEFGQTGSITGNTIWKQMERDKITLHTWQSMKDRYLKHLKGRNVELPFEALQLVQHNGKQVLFANNPSPSKIKRDIVVPKIQNKKTKPNNVDKETFFNKSRKRKLFTKHQAVYGTEGDISDEDENISSFLSQPDEDRSNSDKKSDPQENKNDKDGNSECSIQTNIVSSTSNTFENILSHGLGELDMSREKISFSSCSDEENSSNSSSTTNVTIQVEQLTLSQIVKPILDDIALEDSFDVHLMENAMSVATSHSEHEKDNTESEPDNVVSSSYSSTEDMDICDCQCDQFVDIKIPNDITIFEAINDELMINDFCLEHNINRSDFKNIFDT